MRTTPRSSTSWRRVRLHKLRRVKGAFTLAAGFIVALLAYCLGYQHGSFQRQQTKVETTASTAATPGGLRIGSLRMDDDPAIKYGTAPIRTEPNAPPADVPK